MLKYLFIIILSFQTVFSNGQEIPTLFEQNKISNDGVFGLTISPDSKIALWVSSNGKRDSLKILESRNIGGIWTMPTVASFSTNKGEWKDIDPMFSPDGKTVLFQSNRNANGRVDRKDFDIWAVQLSDTGWTKPYRLDGDINSELSESYASMTKNGTIFFMKEDDIYYSKLKDGKYQTPINIGLPINTDERESNPYISPNGKYIVYFSSDKNGFGEVDLYISFKQKGKWTTPKNLGKKINSAAAEFCPFVHKKEKRLYFSRQEKVGDKFRENIYYINFDVKDFK